MSGTAQLLREAVTRLGGHERAGQQQMAEEVSRTLREPRALLVQAGTGTGKSLGYLVPVLDHAVRHGQRAIVSTATLALQRQVLLHDVPLVADVVADSGAPRPEVALLKGWHNYLCKHKVAGGYPTEDEPGLFAVDAATPASTGSRGPLAEEVLRLREWAEESETGDRDDLDPGVSDRAWRQVSVTKLECLGAKCPMLEECFPEAARRAAHEADVVVTNHAMLGIAAAGSPRVLPEHEVLVVDEAHELADRVTAQATLELSAAVVDRTIRLARKHAAVTADALDAAARALGGYLEVAPEGRMRSVPVELVDAATLLEAGTREAISQLKGEDDAGGRVMARSAMVVLHEIAERLLDDGVAARRDVLWCERGRGGTDAARLHLAPLDVSRPIATDLLAGRAAVLTSATLALGGSFDPVARTLGLPLLAHLDTEDSAAPLRASAGAADDASVVPPTTGATAETSAPGTEPADTPPLRTGWEGIDVGSPFDYGRQGIVYVARHLPPPGRDGPSEAARAELVDLVRAAGGGTLGLFSSRRAAEEAAELLRAELDTPVLCQGEDQLPTLVARFAADEDATLVGTLSLWQGVDVPGRTCRLVVIDRIPFPRPDDPVRSARTEVIGAGGGNGFMSVSATHAALLLAQGAGRLIRSTSDRGMVAVLDSRLATARYGGFLRRSMPPLWPTTDAELARAALRRLAEPASKPAGEPAVRA